MKGDNSYKPNVGERVLISPPNCDNNEGWVYLEMDILWMNDSFILYGTVGNHPNLDKIEHVHIKPLTATEAQGE